MNPEPSSRINRSNGNDAAPRKLIGAAIITLLSKQEMTMFKRETLDTASDVLTDDQLELVSGGVTPDAGGNIPTCPPWFPGHPLGIIPSRGRG